MRANLGRLYFMFYLVNIFLGILYLFNNAYLNEFNLDSSVLLSLGVVAYIIVVFCLFKYKKIVDKFNLLFMGLYVLFLFIFFILTAIYQTINYRNYSMVYFNTLLIVPHIIFIIEGFVIRDKKDKKRK